MWNAGHITPSMNAILVTQRKWFIGVSRLANVSILEQASARLATMANFNQTFILPCNSSLKKITENEKVAIKKKNLSLPVSAKQPSSILDNSTRVEIRAPDNCTALKCDACKYTDRSMQFSVGRVEKG